MKKKYTLYALIGIGACLYTWHWWQKKQLEPVKNDNPRYFVTISGNIEPGISPSIYMGFWVNYAGYNPNCTTTINWLEGIEGMHAKRDFYTAKPDQAGNYEVKIPIDAYKPGKCDWKIARINYSIENQPIQGKDKYYAKQTLMGFGNRSNPNELPGQPIRPDVTAYINSPVIQDHQGYLLFGGYVNSTPRNKNYHYTQNIKKGSQQ